MRTEIVKLIESLQNKDSDKVNMVLDDLKEKYHKTDMMDADRVFVKRILRIFIGDISAYSSEKVTTDTLKKQKTFEHVSFLSTAIPRKSHLGLLLFGHGFFIGHKETPGVEITIMSKRHEPSNPNGATWFRWKNWG